jgi:hypothetical protein
MPDDLSQSTILQAMLDSANERILELEAENARLRNRSPDNMSTAPIYPGNPGDFEHDLMSARDFYRRHLTAIDALIAGQQG